MVVSKNIGIKENTKRPFIKLFDENNKALYVGFIEKLYLLFKDLEMITNKDNIFRTLNESIFD